MERNILMLQGPLHAKLRLSTKTSPNKFCAKCVHLSCALLELTCFVQDMEPHNFDHENPFVTDEKDVASVAYRYVRILPQSAVGLLMLAHRYRKFTLGNGSTLVVRCSLDAIQKKKQKKPSYLVVKALNEYDPRLCKCSC